MYVKPRIDAIKSRRELLGMSRCMLSRKSGLALNAIARIEKEETKCVHKLRALAIAEALDCKLEDVFEIK